MERSVSLKNVTCHRKIKIESNADISFYLPSVADLPC